MSYNNIDDNVRIIVNATEYGLTEDQRYLFEDKMKEEERRLNEKYMNKYGNKKIKFDIRRAIGGSVKPTRSKNIIAVDYSSMYNNWSNKNILSLSDSWEPSVPNSIVLFKLNN